MCPTRFEILPSADVNSPIPDNCPECECELYPSRHTRPRPVRTALGRLVLMGGFLLSGLVFLGGIAVCVLLMSSCKPRYAEWRWRISKRACRHWNRPRN